VGKNRLWLLLLKRLDSTVETTISARRQWSRSSLDMTVWKSADSGAAKAYLGWSSSSSRSTRISTRGTLPDAGAAL
jgi:hypothetical protein